LSAQFKPGRVAELAGAGLYRDVQVRALAAEEQVADRPADQKHARAEAVANPPQTAEQLGVLAAGKQVRQRCRTRSPCCGPRLLPCRAA